MDLSWGLFLPLILAGVLFALISIAAGITSNRGNEAGAERLRDMGFLVVLLSGVWVIVLLLLSLFSEPDEIWDMIVITLVIVVFFALLLLVFFGLSMLFGLFGRFTRRFSRRSRVTAERP